jgi:D-proline reductase (dithiol) PrdB
MRESMAEIAVIDFGDPAFTTPKPLAQARVAIVTTSGLMRPGAEPWQHGQTSFRVIDRDERDLVVSHISPNFDRTGVAADLNVVYPIDRLEELAREGVIGEVAPRHLSFQGAMGNGPQNGPGVPTQLRTVVLDSGPAAARLLLDDRVDVVVLTPV